MLPLFQANSSSVLAAAAHKWARMSLFLANQSTNCLETFCDPYELNEPIVSACRVFIFYFYAIKLDPCLTGMEFLASTSGPLLFLQWTFHLSHQLFIVLKKPALSVLNPFLLRSRKNTKN